MGRRVVYLAESPAAAMLEVLVHLKEREEGLPRIYTLLRIEALDDLAVKQLNAIAPTDWKERPDYTRNLGDAWLASLETPLARVPSAIIPRTWNYLLNPEHPDAKQVVFAWLRTMEQRSWRGRIIGGRRSSRSALHLFWDLLRGWGLHSGSGYMWRGRYGAKPLIHGNLRLDTEEWT